jgi:hypothetical protein
MTEQSFLTCSLANGCFDPCCDAPCPKHANSDDPCGIEQGSNECFKIVCPTCTIYQEKDNADKYTNENILSEIENETDGLLSNISPENLGRPLCIIMFGDNGYYYRTSPAFNGDYETLMNCLNYLSEDFKERSSE